MQTTIPEPVEEALHELTSSIATLTNCFIIICGAIVMTYLFLAIELRSLNSAIKSKTS